MCQEHAYLSSNTHVISSIYKCVFLVVLLSGAMYCVMLTCTLVLVPRRVAGLNPWLSTLPFFFFLPVLKVNSPEGNRLIEVTFTEKRVFKQQTPKDGILMTVKKLSDVKITMKQFGNNFPGFTQVSYNSFILCRTNWDFFIIFNADVTLVNIIIHTFPFIFDDNFKLSV